MGVIGRVVVDGALTRTPSRSIWGRSAILDRASRDDAFSEDLVGSGIGSGTVPALQPIFFLFVSVDTVVCSYSMLDACTVFDAGLVGFPVCLALCFVREFQDDEGLNG